MKNTEMNKAKAKPARADGYEESDTGSSDEE
jgi:hypothetical protein